MSDTYETILNKINNLTNDFNKQISELKENLEKAKKEDNKNDYWIPNKYENYYYITALGGIVVDNWENVKEDRFRLSQGNIFRTKEEAEKKLFKLKLEGKARLFQMRHNDKIDWSNFEQEKYYVYYYYKKSYINVDDDYAYNTQPKLGYFLSRELAQQFIDENKADLIKYFTE